MGPKQPDLTLRLPYQTLHGFHHRFVFVDGEQATNNAEGVKTHQHHVDRTFPSHQVDYGGGYENQAAQEQ